MEEQTLKSIAEYWLREYPNNGEYIPKMIDELKEHIATVLTNDDILEGASVNDYHWNAIKLSKKYYIQLIKEME